MLKLNLSLAVFIVGTFLAFNCIKASQSTQEDLTEVQQNFRVVCNDLNLFAQPDWLASHPTIKELVIKLQNTPDPDNLSAFSKWLGTNSTLEELTMVDCKLDCSYDTSHQVLISTLGLWLSKNNTLKMLNLSENSLGSSTLSITLALRSNKTLETLILDKTYTKEVDYVSYSLLDELRSNKTLKKFSFCNNLIALEQFKKYFNNKALETLKQDRSDLEIDVTGTVGKFVIYNPK